jgi:hypothetical protein
VHAFFKPWVPILAITLVACAADDTSSGAQARPARSGGGTSGASAANGANPATGMQMNPVGLAPVVGTAGDSMCQPATIAFVVDGSGSMCEPFGNSTRWTELRNALVAKQTGLVYKLQAVATFGLYIYDGTVDLSLAMGGGSSMTMSSGCSAKYLRSKMMGMCPQIVEVKPGQGNAAQIDQKFPMAELGGSTPTDKAMNYVVDDLLKLRGMRKEPQFILLATDGEPNDICMNGMGGDGMAQQAGVIAAVDRAAAAGITTFVISLASDPALQMKLDEAARHGNKLDPMAHSYTPTNSTELVSVLTKLLGTAIGCPF